MRVVFIVLVMWTLLLALLLGVGFGIGLLLERLLGIDRGSALLSGLVATCATTYFLIEIIRAAKATYDDMLEDKAKAKENAVAEFEKFILAPDIGRRSRKSNRRSQNRSQDM